MGSRFTGSTRGLQERQRGISSHVCRQRTFQRSCFRQDQTSREKPCRDHPNDEGHWRSIGSRMRTDTVPRFGLRVSLVLAMVGIAAQIVGRAKVVHAYARAQDLYAILTVLGVVITSCSLGAAFFIFVRAPVTRALMTGISFGLAVCLVLGLLFLGIYL